MKKGIILAILIAIVLTAFAGDSKTVQFKIVDFNGDLFNFEIYPYSNVSFIAWIKGREYEVISSKDSVATGFFSNKDMSIAMIDVGYFPTPWQSNDTLSVKFTSTGDSITWHTKSASQPMDNTDDPEQFGINLLANEVFVENLVIDCSSGNPILSWTEKEMGPYDSYYVMKSADPYANFKDDWQYACVDLQVNTWEDAIDMKMFYCVIFSSACPPDMVVIPNGDFIMGQDQISTPEHSVTISKSIFMGKYEVTQKEWTDIMGSNPASGFGVGDNYPVYSVSWYDILVYCNKRSEAEGLDPCYSIDGSTNTVVWGAIPTSANTLWDAVVCNWDANGYRLPTEAEWEYAAQYEDERTFPWGETTPSIDYCNYNNNSGITTTEVGSFPNGKSELELYDMAGNVWEWVWDRYEVYSETQQTDPTGALSGTNRCYRGGSRTSTSQDHLKCSFRANNYPWLKASIGLRVVRK